MIDARGAVVRGPDRRGKFIVDEPGFVHPSYYELLPGARFNIDYEKWRLPLNVVPTIAKKSRPRYAVPQGDIELRSYQLECLAQLHDAARGMLIALDVGLGKTQVACAYVYKHKLKPFVITGPLISAAAWVGEDADPFKYWGLRVKQLRTRSPHLDKMKLDDGSYPDGYFVNFEILPDWLIWLQGVVPRAIIVDECQHVRNRWTQAGRATKKLCAHRAVKKRMLLSATPIVSSVMDMWAHLDECQPWGYGSKVDFGVRYANAYPGEYGWVYRGESNVAELRQRMEGTVFARSRFEVRDDLPKFERTVCHVPQEALDEEAFEKYWEVVADCRTLLRSEGKTLQGAELQKYGLMLRLMSQAKRDAAVSEAKNLLAGHKKLLVFTWHKELARYISDKLTRSGVTVFGPITSDTTKRQRDNLLQALWDLEVALNPSGAVCVATLGTAGQSLNKLACCSAALFTELWYVPSVLLQAEGRIHREGQVADEVLVRYLVVQDSVDSLMYEHLEEKARVAERVLHDAEGVSLCETLGGPDATAKSDMQRLFEELAALEGEAEL